MKYKQIQPKFKYDYIKYTGNDDILQSFLEDHDFEFLKLEFDDDIEEYVVYVLDINKEVQTFYFRYDWYIWIDEMNYINTGEQSYVEDNFKFVKECKKLDKVIQFKKEL